MNSKLVKILTLVLALCFNHSVANLPEKTKAFYSNEDNKFIFRHLIKSVSEDGSLITFQNNMAVNVTWWYKSVPRGWKEGDQVYLTYDFTNNQFQIQHSTQQTIAWSTLSNRPSPLYCITAIPKGLDDSDAGSKIVLDSGYIFKSNIPESFSINNWKVKDRVFIIANPGDVYQIWNVEKNQIVFCELLSNQKQAMKAPLVIQDILTLEDRLNAKVLQQPEATNALLSSLLNYTAGLKEEEKPIGVFLFIGPTGVGKTELAKTLALEIFGDPARILRFDMSHFTESYSINRLIGSPPGYVNHEEGGQLTGPLTDNSQIIVLLDEIEKAHPQVAKTFLPVFDEGFIKNNKNQHISCSDTIFIMTSNLCSNTIVELYNQGLSSEDILALIEPELIEALSPELYNRVEPILFRPIAKETMGMLVDLMLSKVTARLQKEKQIHIHVDFTLKNFLIENGFHPLLGARPLKKLIEKSILTTLAYTIVKEGITPGSEINLLYDKETNTIIVDML